MIFKILVLLICMQIVKVSSQGGQSENTEPNSNLEENSRKNGYEKFNTRDDNQAIGSENAVSNLNPGDRRPSKPRIEKPGDRRPGKDLKKKVQSLIDNVDKFEHEIEKKKKNLLKSVKIAIQSSCTDDKNDEENSRKNGHEKFSISDDNKERKALNPSSNLNPKDETNIVERKTGDNSEKRGQVLSQGDRTWSHDRDFKKNVQSLIDTVDEFELEFEKTTTDLLKSMKLAIQNPCTDDKNNVDGKYGEWNSWGTCSVSCGKGVQTRQRECDSPKPQYGGNTCELLGSNQETKNCVDKECSITVWGKWSDTCKCSSCFEQKERTCVSALQPGHGDACIENAKEVKTCLTPPNIILCMTDEIGFKKQDHKIFKPNCNNYKFNN